MKLRPYLHVWTAAALALAAEGCATSPATEPAPSLKMRPATTVQAPSSPSDGLYSDAVAAISRRDYARALESLQAARDRVPNDPRVLNAFAVVYDKLGRFDLSQRYYAQAAAVDPGSAIVAQNQAYSQRLQGLPQSVGQPDVKLASAPPAARLADSRPAPTQQRKANASEGQPIRLAVAEPPKLASPTPAPAPAPPPSPRPSKAAPLDRAPQAPTQTYVRPTPVSAGAAQAIAASRPAPPPQSVSVVRASLPDSRPPRDLARVEAQPAQGPVASPMRATPSAAAVPGALAPGRAAPLRESVTANRQAATAAATSESRPVLAANGNPAPRARSLIDATSAAPNAVKPTVRSVIETAPVSPTAPERRSVAQPPSKSADPVPTVTRAALVRTPDASRLASPSAPTRPASGALSGLPKKATAPLPVRLAAPRVASQVSSSTAGRGPTMSTRIGRPVTVVYASGNRRTAEQLRAQLARRGWTVAKASSRTGMRMQTTIRYEARNERVAFALARSLTIPVRMVRCQNACGGVTLMIGDRPGRTITRRAMLDVEYRGVS